jgi:hypothetical protein
MPFAGKVGFRGIAKIGDTYLRFASFDISVKQEPNAFLPAYGGTGLKTIFSRGTKDITGTVSGPLTDEKGAFLYNLAAQQSEFMMDLNHYDNQTRRLLGCKIDSLSLSATAGELVNFSANIVAKDTVMKRTISLEYTKGEKIYTHDKCFIEFSSGIYSGAKIPSFTYTITNGYKAVKTGESLGVTILGNAIQDISGQISFLNDGDLIVPVTDGQYGLSFNNTRFVIGDIDVTHDIVFHPAENIQLNPGLVMSNVSWTRADSYYG